MFLHSSKRRTVHRSCARQIVKGKVTITIGGTPDFSVVQKRIMPQDHKVAYFTTLTARTKKERLLDLASGSSRGFMLLVRRAAAPSPQDSRLTTGLVATSFHLTTSGYLSPISRRLLDHGVDISLRNRME